MRTLQLSDQDQEIYQLAYQAVVLSQRQTPVAEWEDVVSLLRKLKAVGVPAKERIGTVQLMELAPGGGTVSLERNEHRILLECVEATSWTPLALETAAKLRSTLQALKEVE